MSIVVNFFAGPGTGKSTMMAATFAELKRRGVCAEMAPEFAKEVVWGDRTAQLEDQIYIFAKQHHRLRRLVNKVDVVLTDSPLLFGLLYGKDESKEYHALVTEVFERYQNMNILLERNKDFEPRGRLQTEDEAKELDFKVRLLLIEGDYRFWDMKPCPNAAKLLAQTIKDTL